MTGRHAVRVWLANVCIVGVDEATTVLKIRNGGNFDFAAKKWLGTAALTRLL